MTHKNYKEKENGTNLADNGVILLESSPFIANTITNFLPKTFCPYIMCGPRILESFLL